MSQLRVFLSYSRLDYEKILRITHILSEIGFLPAWDNEIVAGSEFSDYIRNQIAKSHVFMPVLTPNSIDKPWLNQELGYALGIGVPILPVSIGALPQAMIAGIHSIRVDDELSQLREGICRANPESLLLSSSIEGEMELLRA